MPSEPRIVVVVPTIRPESHASFVRAWTPLFEKHKVTLVTVWDGDKPVINVHYQFDKDYPGRGSNKGFDYPPEHFVPNDRDLFCRRTDACRNLGFVAAAQMNPTHVLTMDDDVTPAMSYTSILGRSDDPIQSHLDALDRRVPLSWMNTAHDTELYLRGVPYGVRTEAPAMLSHGVWVGVPDFDGETQLRLETESDGGPTITNPGKLPHSLPYYVGPVPRGVLFPLCGMNVMVRAAALPYLYFAPMGMDAGVYEERQVDQTAGGTHTFKIPTLHRFADIFMGVFLKRKFDELGWGCVTGYSTVLHTRASDARKNFEQEKLGREWMEEWEHGWDSKFYHHETAEMEAYMRSYADKRTRYETLVKSLLEKTA